MILHTTSQQERLDPGKRLDSVKNTRFSEKAGFRENVELNTEDAELNKRER